MRLRFPGIGALLPSALAGQGGGTPPGAPQPTPGTRPLAPARRAAATARGRFLSLEEAADAMGLASGEVLELLGRGALAWRRAPLAPGGIEVEPAVLSGAGAVPSLAARCEARTAESREAEAAPPTPSPPAGQPPRRRRRPSGPALRG